jgi:NAD-dependent deacetylase
MDPAPPDAPALQAAAEMIRDGRRIVVMTGAGISTDSGIPDFRGPQGVWTTNPAAERMSTLKDYLEDPRVRRMAWQNRLFHPGWKAVPNAGHRALLALQQDGRLRAVLTQNIDGLHQRSGIDPGVVVELHGSMRGVVCWTCGWRAPMQEALDRVRAGDPDPHCEECGGILKSTTVSFGQALDPEVLARADAAAREADVVLAVGTTLSVHPAAGYLPVAKRSGAEVVIVNGEPTAMDRLADVVVRGPIGEVLPRLVG